MTFNFDHVPQRLGTDSQKWQKYAGRDILPLWVADMDFRPPACVQKSVEAMAAHGVYGYFGDDAAYLEAIRWWMQTRHGWALDTGDIFTTHGLVNGTALCVEAFTAPGDGVVLMTPVYHAFARVISAAGRRVAEAAGPPEQGSNNWPEQQRRR